MLFISSQPSVTNNVKYLMYFLVWQNHSRLVLLKSWTPVGSHRGICAVCQMVWKQPLLCCSHHSYLYMPRFIKLFSHRSSKNLKLIIFPPSLNTDNPRFVTRILQTELVVCHSLSPGRISVSDDYSIYLGSGYCCCSYEDNAFGSRNSAELH